MNEYQKVIRGRESLRKLPDLIEKLGIHNPLIVGMEPLTGTLLKKKPLPPFNSGLFRLSSQSRPFRHRKRR